MRENLENENSLGALATRSTAADWLVARQMSEKWTEEDQAGLDRWLGQSPANRIAYWRLDGAWRQAKRLTALRQPMRPSSQPQSSGRGSRAFKFATAAILVAAVGAIGGQYLVGSAVKTYSTPVGGRLTVSLKDGSRIELNTNSVLRVYGDAGHRLASLDRGEAYFQIEHDAARPFVVSVGKQRIVDLGTKFSVRTGNGTVRVALIEGSAKIETTDGAANQQRILVPGDVAVAKANAISVTKKVVSRLNDGLAWRRGMIEFDRTTLAEAAGEFNRYNQIKVVIADPSIAKLTIHGTFPAQDVWAFADAAQAYFHLHAEKRGSAIVISH